MNALADRIDRLNAAIGRAVAWLALVVVLLQFALVVARYVFGARLDLADRNRHLRPCRAVHAGGGLDAAAGGHVRVDVFYAERLAARQGAGRSRRRAASAAAVHAGADLAVACPMSARSWAILERSRESSGLPLVFLLKTLIPLFAALMALQGVAQAIRAAHVLARVATARR